MHNLKSLKCLLMVQPMMMIRSMLTSPAMTRSLAQNLLFADHSQTNMTTPMLLLNLMTLIEALDGKVLGLI